MRGKWAGTLLPLALFVAGSIAVLAASDGRGRLPSDRTARDQDPRLELMECIDRGECPLANEALRLAPGSRELATSGNRVSDFVCTAVGLCSD